MDRDGLASEDRTGLETMECLGLEAGDRPWSEDIGRLAEEDHG